MPHKLVAELLQPALPGVGTRAAAHAEAIAEGRCGRGAGVGELLQAAGEARGNCRMPPSLAAKENQGKKRHRA